MATIKDVSELAKVSQATVSRVVNGNTRVSHEKKIRVEQAMKELGYRPNSIAKALASNRSGSIGIVVPELGSSFYAGTLQNLEIELKKFGYHVIVTAGGETEKSQKEAIDFLETRCVDGFILHTQEIKDDYLIELSQQGVNIVVLNRFIPELTDSCVFLDHELGAMLATKYLLDLGHKRIACITGPLFKSDARARLQGYRTALEEKGLCFDEKRIAEGCYTEETGATAMSKLLQRDIEFSAVFCSNDHMAFGAAQVLREAGYQLPQEMSIIGFDNVSFARYTTPGLTTINFPVEQMSIEAVNLVLQKINKKQPNVQFRLSPSLVVRESTVKQPTINI